MPVQVAVSVDQADLLEAEDTASCVLLVSVPLTVSSLVPTITSETVSAITTVTESNNIIYEILKQAQVHKTQTNVAQQPPIEKGENFIQMSEHMAKRVILHVEFNEALVILILVL